jgi:hypothetical protein
VVNFSVTDSPCVWGGTRDQMAAWKYCGRVRVSAGGGRKLAGCGEKPPR